MVPPSGPCWRSAAPHSSGLTGGGIEPHSSGCHAHLLSLPLELPLVFQMDSCLLSVYLTTVTLSSGPLCGKYYCLCFPGDITQAPNCLIAHWGDCDLNLCFLTQYQLSLLCLCSLGPVYTGGQDLFETWWCLQQPDLEL